MMRVIITSFSIAAALAAADPAAAQAGKPAIRACDVMTPDMVAKYDTQDPKIRKLIPRNEEAMGPHGSSCSDGGIRIQVNPFANPDTYRKKPQKDWVAISGVGDTAYFHNNWDRWAELIVWSGSHHFTIQLSVPNGGTAESVKPNTIGLATAMIARLKSM